MGERPTGLGACLKGDHPTRFRYHSPHHNVEEDLSIDSTHINFL